MMERKTIGIDLGHCETTAAYPRQTQSDRYEVRRLCLMGKDQVISTQIVLTDEQMRKLKGHPMPDCELLRTLGEIPIGDNLSAYVAGGEKFSYFKTAPKNFDKPCGNSACAKQCGITHGMLMACFAFSVVNNLLKFNVGDIDAEERENLDLLIGCPSTGDWTSLTAQAAYAKLILAATNVHDVRIVPESRAAMFSSVENGQGRISALDGALVFDFGSSTADCTYMLLGRKLLEFSWTLGASKIELQIVQNAYMETVKSHGPFSASAASIVDSADQVRKAKESYYLGNNRIPIYCSFEDMKDERIIDTPVLINSKYMKKVIEEDKMQVLCDSHTTLSNSWKELCRLFFQEAARQISGASYRVVENGEKKQIPCAAENIVLTGGASRMDFIYQLCQEVFPNAHIYRETNPSHTVSNGLAWVAVSDENLAVCKEAAQQEIAGNHDCDVSTLQNKLCDALFEHVIAVGEERTMAWANRPEENVSVRELQNDLTACMDSSEFRRAVEIICRAEIEKWKSVLSESMENAVNNQVKKLYSEQVARGLMIPRDIWQELRSGALSGAQIDMGDPLKYIDMSTVVLKIGKMVVMAVIWAIAVALAPGTFGLSILVGFVADLVAEAAMTDTDLDKPRNKNTRAKAAKKIHAKLKESKAEILKGFRESLEEQTEGYSEIVEKTLTAAFEVVTLRRFEV